MRSHVSGSISLGVMHSRTASAHNECNLPEDKNAFIVTVHWKVRVAFACFFTFPLFGFLFYSYFITRRFGCIRTVDTGHRANRYGKKLIFMKNSENFASELELSFIMRARSARHPKHKSVETTLAPLRFYAEWAVCARVCVWGVCAVVWPRPAAFVVYAPVVRHSFAMSSRPFGIETFQRSQQTLNSKAKRSKR